MTVLQLISSGGLYGAETVLINLSRSLVRSGTGCVIGVFHNAHKPNTEIADSARRQGLPVEIIPCRGQADWQAVRAIRECIKARGIDLIHTHGYKADLYGYAAARALGKPLVATCHNWPGTSVALRLYALLDRFVLRRFHRVVAISEGVADTLRRAGVAPGRISIIDNGVELSKFAGAAPTLAREIQKGERVVVGTVGRLAPEKAYDNFLRAAQQLLADFPETLFVLVGEGPMRGPLEDLVRQLGIEDHVIFAGQRADVPGVYASLDIFVLPSLDEGMPMVILEALAASRPVVASRVGAIPRLIPDERTGLLVAPGDVAGLGQAIARLLADPDLRRQMGENGQAWVRQHYSAEAMVESYLNLYAGLVNNPAAATQDPRASRGSESQRALGRVRG